MKYISSTRYLYEESKKDRTVDLPHLKSSHPWECTRDQFVLWTFQRCTRKHEKIQTHSYTSLSKSKAKFWNGLILLMILSMFLCCLIREVCWALKQREWLKLIPNWQNSDTEVRQSVASHGVGRSNWVESKLIHPLIPQRWVRKRDIDNRARTPTKVTIVSDQFATPGFCPFCFGAH